MALPDIGAVLAEALAPAELDVALCQSPTSFGRLTFDWSGPGGDLRFDDSAGYPVLSTTLARRGLYRWDRTYGTSLYRVKKDQRATASQLRAAVREGGAQVEADGLALAVTGQPDRLGAGLWRLGLRWVAAGHDRQQVLRF